MEQQHHPQAHPNNAVTPPAPCTAELIDDKSPEDALMVDLDETTKHKNVEADHHTLLEELQRTRSHSSSSSDEEVEEGGERKKKKKKGLKEKIKETFAGEKQGKANDEEDATPVVGNEEYNDEVDKAEAAPDQEEKEGFLEKIKEKLPGHHKTTEDANATTAHVDEDHPPAENKGFLDKIKEKLPGHQKNEGDDTKEKYN